jgi:excinuclease ABC subunit A
MWTRSSAFRRRWPSSSAPARGGRKSTVATLTEIYHFLRLLYVKLGTAALPGLPDVADRAAEPSSSDRRAQLLRDYRGQHIGLLAPLVVAPQGRLHRPGQVGRGARATPTCASTASSCPPTSGRGSTASREHTHRAAGGRPGRRARTRGTRCAALLAPALELGKGVVHVLAPLDGLQAAMASERPARRIGCVAVFSTKRACPACGTQLRRARPAPVLVQLASTAGAPAASAPA